jgi:hypothetical protein
VNANLIDAAVARGIIDAGQADGLRALAAELDGDVVIGPARPDAEGGRVEARRGFNGVTIAYSAGALLVLFALGWFLVDRWTELGALGVLVTSALYATAFAVTGMLLRRRGFRVAAALVATLAVCMTPVWTYAILRLVGEWPSPELWNDPVMRRQPWIATRLIILELATIGVALATIRRVRSFVVSLPLAAAFMGLLLHLGQALGDPRTAWYTGKYYTATCACLVLAIAYLIDRNQSPDEDHALWFYIGGEAMLLFAYMFLWNSLGPWRHALPLTASAFLVAALYLQRRVLLVGTGLAAFGYLAYLAFDVFERVLALPVALAGLGLLVIVATVWAQRRFPTLVERVSRAGGPGKKRLPAHLVAAFGPFAIALTALIFAGREAEERTVDREFRERLYRRRAPMPTEQATGNRGPGTGSREQGTGNRGPGTGNRPPRTDSTDARPVTPPPR